MAATTRATTRDQADDPPGHGAGFTLIELMVVAAIIAALLTVTMPAIKGLMEVSQLAQADNLLRSVLLSSRVYALRNNVVAGVRFQDDGRMVQVYAVNSDHRYNIDNYGASPPPYDMRAVEGVEPEKMPDPWRVSVRDVGKFHYYFTWPGTWQSNSHWLEAGAGVDGWFVFPVVLFSTRGKVVLGECVFKRSPSWYPTLDGSFGKVTDIVYRYQGASQADQFTITAPTTTTQPMLFNYLEFKGACKSDLDNALMGLDASSSDCILNVNTGLPVRTGDTRSTLNN